MKAERERIPEGEHPRPFRRIGVSEPVSVNREADLRRAEAGVQKDWMTKQSEIVELAVGEPSPLLPRFIEVKVGVSRMVRVWHQFSGPQHLVHVSVRHGLPKARRNIEVRRGGNVDTDETDQQSRRAE